MAWLHRPSPNPSSPMTYQDLAVVSGIKESDLQSQCSLPYQAPSQVDGQEVLLPVKLHGKSEKDCQSLRLSSTPSTHASSLRQPTCRIYHSCLSSQKDLPLLTTRRHPSSAKMTIQIYPSPASASMPLPASHLHLHGLLPHSDALEASIKYRGHVHPGPTTMEQISSCTLLLLHLQPLALPTPRQSFSHQLPHPASQHRFHLHT